MEDFQLATTLDKAIEILKNDNFDPSKSIILEKDPKIEKENELLNSKITAAEFNNSKITIEADVGKEAIVVVSDSFYPGWKAKVDGENTEIFAANINSKAVIVPRGKHKIEFSYRPKNIEYSAPTSVISLVISSLILLKTRRRSLT